jgi:hypothetical protein
MERRPTTAIHMRRHHRRSTTTVTD